MKLPIAIICLTSASAFALPTLRLISSTPLRVRTQDDIVLSQTVKPSAQDTIPSGNANASSTLALDNFTSQDCSGYLFTETATSAASDPSARTCIQPDPGVASFSLMAASGCAAYVRVGVSCGAVGEDFGEQLAVGRCWWVSPAATTAITIVCE